MSTSVGSGLDGYAFKARYLPAFIVVLPAWLAFAVWFPPDKKFEGVFASAGVTLVLGAILAQLGRDAGRRRQKALFGEWGGSPTSRALAYRHKVTNPITLARCHKALCELIPTLKLPAGENDEVADWPASTVKYESAADFLREATRDKSKFRLVYAENVNYGFRRNLWGMKSGGVAIAILGIAGTVAHAAKTYLHAGTMQGLDAAALVLCVGLLALWMFRFNKPWVRIAAEAYASQLVAAAETLAKEKTEA